MHSPINIVMQQQRNDTINLWRLVYSYIWRNVQPFLHRLFIGWKRHSAIPLSNDRDKSEYPPRNKQISQILLRSPIFSIFRGITLVIREKNTTFADEKSVLLISAEHCRI